jgi:hypothetical protein
MREPTRRTWNPSHYKGSREMVYATARTDELTGTISYGRVHRTPEEAARWLEVKLKQSNDYSTIRISRGKLQKVGLAREIAHLLAHYDIEDQQAIISALTEVA